MPDSDRKLWPFKVHMSLIAAVGLLLGLWLTMGILRATTDWPGEEVETRVLIGVLVLSLLPIVLAIFDTVIERGGAIEISGVKIDFSKVPRMGTSGITVPVNIGVRGQAVSDSSTTEILDALKQATSSDIAIIDLESGNAWWETRLLVLLAGAERLGRPGKIVFVGTDAGQPHCYQGWASPDDLVPLLAKANPQYARSLEAARAAARQWELVEPVNPIEPPPASKMPVQPEWINTGLASRFSLWAFDEKTGLPNELLAEQLLQHDLGEKIELQAGSKGISLFRLEELFRPVLNKDRVDQSWAVEKQLEAFFNSQAPCIAITQNRRYLTLVSRLTVLNDLLRVVVEKNEELSKGQ